ncbi:hypothetical protein T492DRAFT_881985 [Pavlovales sp. CCMP2436]|nr:hypothetical protein T492DRAFT_881985 [Pavlovales sp. CCMP2436]
MPTWNPYVPFAALLSDWAPTRKSLPAQLHKALTMPQLLQQQLRLLLLRRKALRTVTGRPEASCECELIVFLPANRIPAWVLTFALYVPAML